MFCPKHPNYKGLRKPQRDCPICQAVYETKQAEKRVNILEEQVKELTKQSTIIVHPYTQKRIKFGLISDTHLGSMYEELEFLKFAYKIFKKEKIENVYHAGDVLEGEKIYRGQEYEIRYHGVDEQVEHCVKDYPKIDGITTYFIDGNHTLSFHNEAGVDVGRIINLQRKDLVYVGKEEADIRLENKNGSCILRLVHPGGGTAYAISYTVQKYINSLTGGEKPNIVGIGHFHKTEYLFFRNVHAFQAGCFQAQTPFMRRKRTPAMVGFWIIDITLDKGSVIRCRGEFIPKFN
jgi:predicted phosphodiesterase